MKIKLAALCILILAGTGVFSASQLRLQEIMLSASYQMLACEKCYHMTIEKSEALSDLGETIVPSSSTVDIEEMIDSIALSKAAVCLRGQFFRFPISWSNISWLKLSPGGKRFWVLAQENVESCAGL